MFDGESMAESEPKVLIWHEIKWVPKDDYDTAQTRIRELEAALRGAKRLFDEALPKFDWGRSALDANAIKLLNEVPRLVNLALA